MLEVKKNKKILKREKISEGIGNEMILVHMCTQTLTFLENTICWVVERNLIPIVDECHSLRIKFFDITHKLLKPSKRKSTT